MIEEPSKGELVFYTGVYKEEPPSISIICLSLATSPYMLLPSSLKDWNASRYFAQFERLKLYKLMVSLWEKFYSINKCSISSLALCTRDKR